MLHKNVRRVARSAAFSVLAVFAGDAGAGDDNTPPCMKDAMLVFDASGSMGTTDFTAKKPHIDRVKEAMRIVMPEIPPERRLGLIVYGQGAYNKCDSIELKLSPETNSGPVIMREIEKITPAGRTPLTESVYQAAEVLKHKQNPSIIVLLTDGEETCGGKTCQVAKQLKKEGKDTTVHVIGYRNKEAGGLSGTFGARCLAEETGGLYISVSTVDQLIDAMRKTLTCPLFTEKQPQNPASKASSTAADLAILPPLKMDQASTLR